jgi:hypothetical protein
MSGALNLDYRLRLAVTWSWRRCDGVVRFARGPRMPYYERNLRHWIPEGKNLFVTWRLYGSLPAAIMEAWRKTQNLKDGKRFRFIDRAILAGRIVRPLGTEFGLVRSSAFT